MLLRSILPCIPALALLAPSPLMAQAPEAVSKMIDAALRSGDAAGLEAVIRFAKQAHPQAAEAIDAQVAAFRTTQASAAPAPAPAPVVTAQASETPAPHPSRRPRRNPRPGRHQPSRRPP